LTSLWHCRKIKEHRYTIAFHGYSGDRPHTLVGGTDRKLAKAIVKSLKKSDFSAELVKVDGKFAGTAEENINNESQSGMSVSKKSARLKGKSFSKTFPIKRGRKQKREHSANMSRRSEGCCRTDAENGNSCYSVYELLKHEGGIKNGTKRPHRSGIYVPPPGDRRTDSKD
jgi:hypothetical protein